MKNPIHRIPRMITFGAMAVGRPRIWQNVDDLVKAIDEYFTPKDDGQHFKPTVTGLALFLGFSDKSSLYEYRDRPEFSDPLKRALTSIEQYHEERLSENSVAGSIFALKNMGWKDKTEQDLNISGTPIQIIMPPDE